MRAAEAPAASRRSPTASPAAPAAEPYPASGRGPCGSPRAVRAKCNHLATRFELFWLQRWGRNGLKSSKQFNRLALPVPRIVPHP